jgi:hypothetical protein
MKLRSITAPARWCATRTLAAIAAHAFSCSPSEYSRKCVRLLTFQSSTRTWAELHEQAFRRLGGATKTVVLDNLGEGVLKPDIYDPALNPLYRDVLAHYGVVALPCRVRDPDRKGKVERGVGHAKNTPLKGQRFESLEEVQAYPDRWEAHWADTRIHGTVKPQVAAMFAEEKPALTALPLEPFRHYQFGERRVNLDGCVEVEAAYYSVPPGFDRPNCQCAVGRSRRACARSPVGSAFARTPAPAARRLPDSGRRQTHEDEALDYATADSLRQDRHPHRNTCRADVSARRSDLCPAHFRPDGASAQVWGYSRQRCMRSCVGLRAPGEILISSFATGWSADRCSRFAKSTRSSAN